MGILIQFTPEIDVSIPPVAPDESLTVTQGQSSSVTPVITFDGSPVTPDSLSIVTQPAHGVASVSGVALLYTPTAGYFGQDSFTYQANVGGAQSNVANVTAMVYATPCEELGRVTRIYASGYDRARVHDGQLVRGESRCLVVQFNGAIPAGRTVASVTWRCNNPAAIVMSNARIQTGTRSVAVDVLAGWSRYAAIKCEAILDNGEVYAQLIRLSVLDAPWFQGDTTSTTGPTTLTSP